MAYRQKAWLVTWDWVGPHAAVEDRLAAILRPRLSRHFVREIVECLYATHAYTPAELALWSKRPKENPYKAEWDNRGFCSCGHNPFLTAQYVHDLVVKEDPVTGLEIINYVLPRVYSFETGQRELIREALPESIKRTIDGPLSDREIGHNETSVDTIGQKY